MVAPLDSILISRRRFSRPQEHYFFLVKNHETESLVILANQFGAQDEISILSVRYSISESIENYRRSWKKMRPMYPQYHSHAGKHQSDQVVTELPATANIELEPTFYISYQHTYLMCTHWLLDILQASIPCLLLFFLYNQNHHWNVHIRVVWLKLQK
jgi:hypothetical protein